MKRLLTIIAILCGVIFGGCRYTRDAARVEYIYKSVNDSIYILLTDTVIIDARADTIRIREKITETRTRDRVHRDTVKISDTVRISEAAGIIRAADTSTARRRGFWSGVFFLFFLMFFLFICFFYIYKNENN